MSGTVSSKFTADIQKTDKVVLGNGREESQVALLKRLPSDVIHDGEQGNPDSDETVAQNMRRWSHCDNFFRR
jgi:hypothetical protein